MHNVLTVSVREEMEVGILGILDSEWSNECIDFTIMCL